MQYGSGLWIPQQYLSSPGTLEHTDDLTTYPLHSENCCPALHMQVRFLANNITSSRQSGSTLKHKKQEVQKCIFAKFWENCS